MRIRDWSSDVCSSDLLYTARRGHGAFCNGQPIAVSSTSRLDSACLGIGMGHDEAAGPYTAMLETLLNTRCQYRRLGSGLLLLALAAEGATDGFWHACMKDRKSTRLNSSH